MLLWCFLPLYSISLFSHQNLPPKTQNSPPQSKTTVIIQCAKPETWKLFSIANFSFLPFSIIHKSYWFYLQWPSCLSQLLSLPVANTITISFHLDYHHHLLTLRSHPSFYSCPLPIYSIAAAKTRVLKTKSDSVSPLLRKAPNSFLRQAHYALLFFFFTEMIFVLFT